MIDMNVEFLKHLGVILFNPINDLNHPNSGHPLHYTRIDSRLLLTVSSEPFRAIAYMIHIH